MLVTIGVIGKNEQHEADVVAEATMQAAEEAVAIAFARATQTDRTAVPDRP